MRTEQSAFCTPPPPSQARAHLSSTARVSQPPIAVPPCLILPPPHPTCSPHLPLTRIPSHRRRFFAASRIKQYEARTQNLDSCVTFGDDVSPIGPPRLVDRKHIAGVRRVARVVCLPRGA